MTFNPFAPFRPTPEELQRNTITELHQIAARHNIPIPKTGKCGVGHPLKAEIIESIIAHTTPYCDKV